MVYFTEINQAPQHCSMLRDVGREATPKLATTNSNILATNIDNGMRGGLSQNLCEVLSKKINEK